MDPPLLKGVEIIWCLGFENPVMICFSYILRIFNIISQNKMSLNVINQLYVECFRICGSVHVTRLYFFAFGMLAAIVTSLQKRLFDNSTQNSQKMWMSQHFSTKFPCSTHYLKILSDIGARCIGICRSKMTNSDLVVTAVLARRNCTVDIYINVHVYFLMHIISYIVHHDE